MYNKTDFFIPLSYIYKKKQKKKIKSHAINK